MPVYFFISTSTHQNLFRFYIFTSLCKFQGTKRDRKATQSSWRLINISGLGLRLFSVPIFDSVACRYPIASVLIVQVPVSVSVRAPHPVSCINLQRINCKSGPCVSGVHLGTRHQVVSISTACRHRIFTGNWPNQCNNTLPPEGNVLGELAAHTCYTFA